MTVKKKKKMKSKPLSYKQWVKRYRDYQAPPGGWDLTDSDYNRAEIYSMAREELEEKYPKYEKRFTSKRRIEKMNRNYKTKKKTKGLSTLLMTLGLILGASAVLGVSAYWGLPLWAQKSDSKDVGKLHSFNVAEIIKDSIRNNEPSEDYTIETYTYKKDNIEIVIRNYIYSSEEPTFAKSQMFNEGLYQSYIGIKNDKILWFEVEGIVAEKTVKKTVMLQPVYSADSTAYQAVTLLQIKPFNFTKLLSITAFGMIEKTTKV